MFSKMADPTRMASSLVRSVASTVDSLLADPTTEFAEQDSDRMGGTISVNTGMPQQAIVKPRTTFDPAQSYQDEKAAQNYSALTGALNPMRLVNLSNTEWLVSNVPGDDIMTIRLPQDFYPTPSFPAHGQTRYFKYVRAGFDVTVNFAAAQGIAGLAVVFYVPDGLDMSLRNRLSLFNLPHSIVNLAATSSARLTIPYVNYRSYAEKDSAQCGRVVVSVLTGLTVPTGVTPAVTLSAWGAMMEMDLQNPVPQGRDMVDIAPGPGNLALSNSLPLQGAQSLALVGEGVDADFTTAGVVKSFNNLRDIAQIPGILRMGGVSSWNTSQAIGATVLDTQVGLNIFANSTPNMAFLSGMYGMVRGSIVFRLLFASTPFNKGRVRITYYPNDSTAISLDQAQNGISVIHELGLNTTAELVVPYAGLNYYTRVNAFTGRLTVHVVNRLQANVNAPSSVNILVTMAGGPDIEFASPRGGPVTWQGPEESVITGDGNDLANAAGVSTLENTGGEPRPREVAPALLNVKNVGAVRPTVIKADHMDLNTLSGRGIFLGAFLSTGGLVRVPIVPTNTGFGAFWKLFSYFTGEYTLHFYNDSPTHTIVAQNYAHAQAEQLRDITALGSAVLLPKAAMSLKVPYYSPQPHRLLNPGLVQEGTGMLGTLFFDNRTVHTEQVHSVLAVYISFSGDNFSFPIPVPLILPVREPRDEVEETIERIMNQGPCAVSTIHDMQNVGEVLDLDYTFTHVGATNAREHTCEVRLTKSGLGYTARGVAKTKRMAKEIASTMVLSKIAAQERKVENQGIPNPLSLVSSVATTTVDFINKLFGCIRRCISAVVNEAVYKIVRLTAEVFLHLALVLTGQVSAAAAVAMVAMRFIPDTAQGLSDNLEVAGQILKKFLDYDIEGAYVDIVGVIYQGLCIPVGTIFMDRARREARALFSTSATQAGFGGDSVIHQGVSVREFLMTATIARSLEFWIGFIPRMFAALTNHFNPDGPARASRELSLRAPHLALVCYKAHQFAMKKFDATHEITSAQASEMADVYGQLAAYRDLAVVACDKATTTTIQNVMREVDNYFRSKQVVAPGEQARMEPIGLLMQGPPGSGKSSFQQSLMAQVAGLTGLPRTAYTENINDDFYSGYTGQTFHIKDEFLAGRDEKDGLRTVNEISTTSYSLPMAQLADKGKKYTSKFVIAQTNHREKNIIVSTLHDSGALMRRFPYRVTVVAHDDYKKGAFLDRAKAEDATHGIPAVITGRCWKPVTNPAGRPIPTTTTDGVEHLDMISLCRQIADEYKYKMGIHASASGIYDAAYAEACKVEHQMWSFGSKTEETRSVDSEMINTALSILGERKEAIDPSDPSSELVNPPDPLPQNPDKTYLNYFKNAIKTTSSIISSNKEKVMALLTALGVLGGAVAVAVRALGGSEHTPVESGDAEGRAYGGGQLKVKRVKNTKPIKVRRDVEHQGGDVNSEYAHLWDYVGHIVSPQGVSRPFITYGGKTFMLYTHAFGGATVESDGVIAAGSVLHYLGRQWQLDDYEIEMRPEVLASKKGDVYTERVFVTIPKFPAQFKSSVSHQALPQAMAKTDILHSSYSNGREVRYIQSCYNVRSNVDYSVDDRPQVGLSYNVSHRTFVGLCGAMVVQKQGSNWKIVGLHVAGTRSGSVGYAAAMLPVDLVVHQGEVTSKIKAERVYYTNTKSGIKKSPLHGVFEVTHGPAVLSEYDRRLQVETGPLVYAAADKYHNNKFEPCPNVFALAKKHVMTKLVENIGIHDSLNDYTVATNGLEASNCIDMSTSAGPKYVTKHLSKRDLFKQNPDGSYYPSAQLVTDCDNLLEALKNNRAVVDFGTNTKDEVVKKKKIAAGKTRAVESCSVDYVLVYRDIMGKIYDKIYSTSALATGVAVGINPFTDYHELYQSLHGQIACLDYTQFDGSLSKDLMYHAVDVLAACHADPDLVRRLHKPVVESRHLVGDEIWSVSGGMPSGSPCTSVLNSICNLLVVYSCLYASGYEELNEADVITYGDDVLIACGSQEGDITQVVDYIQEWFGMTATNASKTGTDISEDLETMTFLKRHFRYFPGSGRVIGRLDLDSMKQKIMWCRGAEQFADQFTSFTEELALHGEEVYDSIMKPIRARCVSVGSRLVIPCWRDVICRLRPRVFE
ncbi:hypothetical protein [Wenzhou picorna-like virus 43]|uniref:hypothetical protein n=1 Tax=Wenzhou picorna-like virus 43 TaxID=1923630 RepID=UPI000909DBEE|nr:hypothetical protein [Wenzhou picorna-like virus 43]APG78564.1 hypothetical protein [Wenzhou picorna-like virus 43]